MKKQEIKPIIKEKKIKESLLIKINLNDIKNPSITRFLTPRGIKDWYYKNFKRNRLLLINMELLNGDFASFFVSADSEGYFSGNDQYLFDDSLKYYNWSFKCYCYDFHEGFSLPIKRKFNITKLNKAVADSNMEIEISTSPNVLRVFTEAKMAMWVMKAQELFEEFRRWKMLIIIGLVLQGLILIAVIMICKNLGIINW